jgi:succinate-semialdehyde dehydrogenase/glutarate-semialdehyde dehydrogenase
LIDQAGVAKVTEHLDEALSHGAELVAGERADGKSRLCPPALLKGVPTEALLTREETFGPLAGVIEFETQDQAIRLANDTPFGLASYMVSTNPKTIAQVSRGIESGMVGINTGLISTAVVPFGGVKLSGLGREGSRHGLDEYLNIKYLCEAGL